MKQFKNLYFIHFIIFIMLSSVVKEAFDIKIKIHTDEFLVEKKSPLVMPPDFNELPIPNEKINKEVK